jgi:hypothetical protein
MLIAAILARRISLLIQDEDQGAGLIVPPDCRNIQPC